MTAENRDKKQSEVEKLYQLLHALNRQQIKVLRKYLVSFSTRNEGETKMLELADYLLEKHPAVPDLETCSQKIYQSRRDSRIDKLKNRLYNKVLDSLAIDINIQRDDYEDELHPISIRLRKKAAVFQIIRYTPLRETLGMEILNDIIYQAKKYEIYSILIDHLQVIKYMKAWREGPKVFQKYESMIGFYQKCNRASFRALDNYYKLIMRTSFSAKFDPKTLIPFLEDCISRGQYDFQITKSPSVGYFLKMFEIAYYQELKDYKKAKNAGLEMLSIIQNNPAVYRKQRMGFVTTHIAECNIYLKNYLEALSGIQESTEKYIVPNSSDYFINKELEFQAAFYADEIPRAERIITEFQKTDAVKQGTFRYAKFGYYEACLLFRKGDYKACNLKLSEKFKLSKDRLGWEIGIRILLIMTAVEQKKYDRAQTLLSNLHRHIARNAESRTALSPRDQLILKLFNELDKDGFNYEYVSAKAEKLFLQLRETDTPHSWQVLTPELIPVHEWLKDKIRIRKQVRRKPHAYSRKAS